MKINTVFALLTFGLILFTIATVTSHIAANRDASAEPIVPNGDASAEPAIPSSQRSIIAESQSILVTGLSFTNPVAEDYKLLEAVPWDMRDISKLYRDAGLENSCELLSAGVDVIQPLVEPKPNAAGPLGRRTAFSIHLQVGKQLGAGLPSVTRGIIEDYLNAHQLTIQPTFYYNEEGRLILSPTIRAAFVRLDSPERAAVAEAMIETSIHELRTLGTYWNGKEQFTPADCRTMILGFRYTLDVNEITQKSNAQREYELLFLHLLPESTVANPKVAVFATSDARTQFHLLEEIDPSSKDQMPTITAEVRFADVKMMGMYPQAPIVTRVHHLALLSIPVDLVQAQMAGLGDAASAVGFSEILDLYYRKATTKEEPAAGGTALDPVPVPASTVSDAKTLEERQGLPTEGKPLP